MRDSIRDKVAIIGMGCTKFGELWDKSSEDLIVEAAYEAFDDAKIDPDRIEAAWVGSCFGFSGLCLAAPLKFEGKPVTRVENQCASPIEAVRNAAFAIIAGVYDVVLAMGIEKMKDAGTSGVSTGGAGFMTNWEAYGKDFTGPGSFGLPSLKYFERYGATKEHLAKIAVKNHKNGALSPKAHFQKEITLEQAMNAPIIAWPLGLFDCCPTTDGATAAILCRADIAKQFRDDYITIKGIGLALDGTMHEYKPGFDYDGWPATINASQQAYAMAGITDPFKQIDMAEVHDCFTTTELLTYEDLGFCKRGEAKDFIDSNVFALDGELPVNPSGGLKSFGHPVGASGIRMIYEFYKQFQGTLDNPKRKLKKPPQVGLAHNIGGAPHVSAVCITGAP